jgi:Putative Actinobacterial Holin-X, holin superfamily III
MADGSVSSGGTDLRGDPRGPAPELRERSIPELLKQLSQETSTLVKQELDLAKAEATQQGKRAGKGAGLLGGGTLFGLGAFGALTAFFIALLDLAMVTWLAALIVALVYGAIAAVLALQGKNKIQEATPPTPQTVETLKEDVEWAKTRK